MVVVIVHLIMGIVNRYYIMLSDNIVIPSECDHSTNYPVIDQKSSNTILAANVIPDDSLYDRKSLKVWIENPVGDHYLLTCKIKVSLPLKIPYQQIGNKIKITRWVRQYEKNSMHWCFMKKELQSNLDLWNQYLNKRSSLNINALVQSFNYYVNSAL